MTDLSPRLLAILYALRLRPGLRVVEFGCGPGALARAIAARVAPGGAVLGVDRSARALTLAAGPPVEGLAFRLSAVENFTLAPGEEPYDLAVAIRVGVLDGRHPKDMPRALARIAAALRPGGRLAIDGGDPLLWLSLP